MKIRIYLKRLWVVFALMLAAFSFSLAPAVAANQILPISAPCNFILAPTENPASMQVTWWDKATVQVGSLVYDTSANFAMPVTVEATLKKNDPTQGYSVFEVAMTNLRPNTTYYYKVGADDSGWSEVKSFTTAVGGTDFSFMYLGDVQYSSFNNAAADYQAWGKMILDAKTKFPQMAFGLLGGDLVEQGQSAACWQMFLNQATKVFAQTPMLSISGNHENNAASGKPELYLQLQALPQNGPSGFKEEFYSYDYGENLHITALNSSVFLGEQKLTDFDFAAIKQWLKADLAANFDKWRVVVMHHPAYAVVSDRTAAKVLQEWTPVFEEAKVDLVLCGHQHVYMRTHPMLNGAINQENGVVYVMGNSGSKFYQANQVAYAAKMIADTSTYQIINVSKANLQLMTYNAAGTELDSVTILPKNGTSPTPPPSEIVGDINGDGKLSLLDVAEIISAILICDSSNLAMDLNQDGLIDICDAHALALLCQ